MYKHTYENIHWTVNSLGHFNVLNGETISIFWNNEWIFWSTALNWTGYSITFQQKHIKISPWLHLFWLICVFILMNHCAKSEYFIFYPLIKVEIPVKWMILYQLKWYYFHFKFQKGQTKAKLINFKQNWT